MSTTNKDKRNEGKPNMTSIILDPIISTLPPIYAIVIPKILPEIMPNVTDIIQTLNEYLAPLIILENTSLPCKSVPKK